MNLDQAQTLARELVNQHLGPGWRIEWNDSDRLFGGCQANRRAIQLSRHFAKRCSRDEVLDTILHEIAHGLAPGGVKPHGAEWQGIARRLGARPDPCKDTLIYPHLVPSKSHVRELATVAAALILVAAIVFVVESRGPAPKPQQSLGTAPALSASKTTTTVPVTTLNLGTTTSTPPTTAAPPPTTAAPPRTTVIRTTAKQTPRTTTTTAAKSAPPQAPPATTTTTAPPPPVTTTTFACTKDPYGNCYVAEESCPSNLYNQTVQGADGSITCTQIGVADWQWEYS